MLAKHRVKNRNKITVGFIFMVSIYRNFKQLLYCFICCEETRWFIDLSSPGRKILQLSKIRWNWNWNKNIKKEVLTNKTILTSIKSTTNFHHIYHHGINTLCSIDVLRPGGYDPLFRSINFNKEELIQHHHKNDSTKIYSA